MFLSNAEKKRFVMFYTVATVNGFSEKKNRPRFLVTDRVASFFTCVAFFFISRFVTFFVAVRSNPEPRDGVAFTRVSSTLLRLMFSVRDHSQCALRA